MRLLKSQPLDTRQDATTASIARESIADDLRLMRQMSGPPVLRQAAAGLIHLALSTEPRDWLRHSRARDLAGQCAALRLCRFSLGEIHKAVERSAATALKYHQSEIRGIARAVATPEEITAKIYWETMEKADAAGIDFEQLLSYHYASDASDEF